MTTVPVSQVPQNVVSATPTSTPAASSIPVAANPSTAAATFAPGTVYLDSSTGSTQQVPAAASSTDWVANAEAWLQSSSLIGSVPNYWIVGGAILAGMLFSSGKRRR